MRHQPHALAKNVLQTLAGNAHIFVLSLLVVALAFGTTFGATGARSSTPVKQPSTATQKTHNSSELSTSPATEAKTGGSNNYSSLPSGSSQGSYEGQDKTQQNANTSVPTPPVPAPPTTTLHASSPPVTCTACSTTAGCSSPCATDPSPYPPSTGCGVCGYGSPPYYRHAGMMCPMYCLNSTQ